MTGDRITTLKEALDQLAKRHELDNEQKRLIIDKWQKELGIQPCEDCISRQAVFDVVFESRKNFNNEFDQGFFADKIRALPPVTPQPKVGHWIVEKGGSYLGMRNGHCSYCNDYYTNDWNEMKYCPNCGAEMVKPQESEET